MLTELKGKEKMMSKIGKDECKGKNNNKIHSHSSKGTEWMQGKKR
jgi:hypothetical protein